MFDYLLIPAFNVSFVFFFNSRRASKICLGPTIRALLKALQRLLGISSGAPTEGVRIPKAHRGGSWRPPEAYRRSLAGDPSWSPQSPGALGARARALTRSPKAGEILRGPLGSRRKGVPLFTSGGLKLPIVSWSSISAEKQWNRKVWGHISGSVSGQFLDHFYDHFGCQNWQKRWSKS